MRNADASSVGDSERFEIGKPGNKFLFAAGDDGRTDLVVSAEVCGYGKDIWSYGCEEDEYDPWWLLLSLDNTADGAIFPDYYLMSVKSKCVLPPLDLSHWRSLSCSQTHVVTLSPLCAEGRISKVNCCDFGLRHGGMEFSCSDLYSISK